MSRKKLSPFKPDYVVLPGDTLKETIGALGMALTEGTVEGNLKVIPEEAEA